MKKVLFLYPNTGTTPIIPGSIAILSGIALSRGWEIDYFDAVHYDKPQLQIGSRDDSAQFRPLASGQSALKSFSTLVKDLQERLDSFEPDIIAISAITFEFQFLMTFWEKLVISKDTLRIIGGVHSTICPDDVIKTGYFDLVVVGEGESTFDEILELYGTEQFWHIAGTYYLDRASGNYIINERRPLLSSKELWKTPRYLGFYSEDKYYLYPFNGDLVRRYNLTTARGCPWNCSYCGNVALKVANSGLGTYLRVRPVASIREEAQNAIENHGVTMFYFEDECFLTHPTVWLKEFSAWYSSEIKLPFILQTRAETITEEKILLLQSFGAPFFQVSVGVESGSHKILNEICNRKTPISNIRNAFKLLNQNNIRTCAFFMLGLPCETREDVLMSIDLCRDLNPTVAIVSIFQPLPGQPLRDLCINKGYISERELIREFSDSSILTMPPPYLSTEQITSLRQVFMLYAFLPKEYHDQVKLCENDFASNKALYQQLVDTRWKLERMK